MNNIYFNRRIHHCILKVASHFSVFTRSGSAVPIASLVVAAVTPVAAELLGLLILAHEDLGYDGPSQEPNPDTGEYR